MITKSANGSQFYGSIYRDTICILFWIRAFLWENGYDLGLFKTAQSNNICKISERSRISRTPHCAKRNWKGSPEKHCNTGAKED